MPDVLIDQEPELNLLLEEDVEGTRARWREAILGSTIVHLVIIVFLLLQPSLFPTVTRALGIVEADDTPQPPRQLTYLAMPPDDQALQEKVQRGALSDKDRRAKPGVDEPVQAPKLPAPPREQTARPAETPERPAARQERLLAQALPPALPTAPQVNGLGNGQVKLPAPGAPEPPAAEKGAPLQLEEVTRPDSKLQVPASNTFGRSLEDAMRGMAHDQGGGAAVSEFGQAGPDGAPGGSGPFSARGPAAVGDARILSDTMGVDFDPYLRRVVVDIRRNWYSVMPEIARLGKRGRVIVVFEIEKQGGVTKLYLVSSSGFEPLDRAALAGISASVPFPPLPPEFRGPSVRLQVTFLYNLWNQRGARGIR